MPIETLVAQGTAIALTTRTGNEKAPPGRLDEAESKVQ